MIVKIRPKAVTGATFDGLGPDQKRTAVRDERVRDIIADVADASFSEGYVSLQRALKSIDVRFSRNSEIEPFGGVYVSVELNDYGEDNFKASALDPYEGHIDDVPECKGDGYYVGSVVANEWNRERSSLQKIVDDINRKADEYLDSAEGDEGVEDLLWDDEDSVVASDLRLYEREYLYAAKLAAEAGAEVLKDEYESMFEDEFIASYLSGSDFEFDEDGHML